jgi:regulator of nonsense transcripts 2
VAAVANRQVSADVEPGSLSSNQANGDESQDLVWQEEELVEKDVRDRFKRMCEGYFDNVCKKLVIEHKVFTL